MSNVSQSGHHIYSSEQLLRAVSAVTVTNTLLGFQKLTVSTMVEGTVIGITPALLVALRVMPEMTPLEDTVMVTVASAASRSS